MARSNGNGGTTRTYGHPCLIAQTLDVLGDRWTLLVLRDLMTGLRRYTDILQNCGGLSPNVLADRLKKLEAEGLVHRHYERGLPPRVEYTLTEKGWAVRPILLSLVEWGMTFADRFTRQSVGDSVPTDFAVRMIPTFAFQPELAEGVTVSLMLEIDDCEDCSAWTFEVVDGRLLPQRGGRPADLRFRTNTGRLLPLLPRRRPGRVRRAADRPGGASADVPALLPAGPPGPRGVVGRGGHTYREPVPSRRLALSKAQADAA